MNRTTSLVVGLVVLAIGFAALAAFCCWRGVKTPTPADSTVRGLRRLDPVFGPQLAGRRVDPKRIARYEIDVFIVYGGHLTLPQSNNTPITYRGDRLVGEAPSFDPDRRYLCGIVTLREETGWHLTDCVVQLTNGPVRGALVWLVGPPGGGHIGDPYVAWYELPQDVVEGGGTIEFEVIRFY